MRLPRDRPIEVMPESEMEEASTIDSGRETAEENIGVCMMAAWSFPVSVAPSSLVVHFVIVVIFIYIVVIVDVII